MYPKISYTIFVIDFEAKILQIVSKVGGLKIMGTPKAVWFIAAYIFYQKIFAELGALGVPIIFR